ncbi:MAG: helix-turn-helix transcriptional regulator [Pseudomonadota bacterium]
MDHDDLIHHLYAAASDDQIWATLPKHICDSFGGAAMVYADGYVADFDTYRIVQQAYDDDVLKDTGYRLEDNFDAEKNAGFAACLFCPLVESFEAAENYREIEGDRRDFYESCFVRPGIAFPRAFTLIRDGNVAAGGFMARSTTAGPMTPSEVARFDSVLSHLRRATELRVRLDIGRAAETNLAAIVARLDVAVAMVDRDLRVLAQNQALEDMLAARDGLRRSAKTLRLADPGAQKALMRRLRGLYTTGPASVDAPIPARRPSGVRPLAVSVYPANGMGEPVGARAAYACIVVSDPCADATLPEPERLREGPGLTLAEAKVARLTLLSLSVRQMADRLGVAETTVKTHLASARGKLGVGSTAALAKVVARAGFG